MHAIRKEKKCRKKIKTTISKGSYLRTRRTCQKVNPSEKNDYEKKKINLTERDKKIFF